MCEFPRKAADCELAEMVSWVVAGVSEGVTVAGLKARVAAGPIGFRVLVQLANPGEVVDDATIHWAETSHLMELGKISLTGAVADDAEAQRQIIFDPIPRVDGIEPSNDPLLELRAAVYLISGRRRRAAAE